MTSNQSLTYQEKESSIIIISRMNESIYRINQSNHYFRFMIRFIICVCHCNARVCVRLGWSANTAVLFVSA